MKATLSTVRSTVEGGSITRQGMFTMDNGMMGRYTVLVGIQRVRVIGFTKVFGREGNIVDRRQPSSLRLSNFFDHNILLSLLFFSVLIGILFIRTFCPIDDIAVLIDIISGDHFCELFILIVLAVGLIGFSHVLYE